MSKFVYGLAKILKAPVRLFFPTKVFGPRTLPKSRLVMVGNHISGWDPVILYAYLKNHIRFMFKAEFDKSKFLHWAFGGLDFIPVNRGEADLGSVKKCIRTLNDDHCLGLFPEGTRNPDIELLQPLKTGAALIAIKTKSPIRPFYVWDKSRPLRKNYYMIGEDFTLEQFYDKPITKEMLNEATEIIRTKMQEVRFELLAILSSMGVKRRKPTKKELQKIPVYYKLHKDAAAFQGYKIKDETDIEQ